MMPTSASRRVEGCVMSLSMMVMVMVYALRVLGPHER